MVIHQTSVGHNSDRSASARGHSSSRSRRSSSRGRDWGISVRLATLENPEEATGTVIRLISLISSGSFGVVYYAMLDDTPVAVKLVLRPATRAGCHDAARELVYVPSNGACHALPVVRHLFAFIYGPFLGIVLEYCVSTLRHSLARAIRDYPAGMVPLEFGSGVLMAAARTLRAIHAVGVVHRDLKPDNMLFRAYGEYSVLPSTLADAEFQPHKVFVVRPQQQGQNPQNSPKTRSDDGNSVQIASDDDNVSVHDLVLKLVGLAKPDFKPPSRIITAASDLQDNEILVSDFGLATKVRATDSDSSAFMRSVDGAGYARRRAGTPYYIAPETESGICGPAADVYSFGVMAAELLCGRYAAPTIYSQPTVSLRPDLNSPISSEAIRRAITDALRASAFEWAKRPRRGGVGPDGRVHSAAMYTQLVSEKVYNLLMGCLKPKPEDRMSSSELVDAVRELHAAVQRAPSAGSKGVGCMCFGGN